MSLEPLALTFALLVFWIGLGWSVIAVAEPEMQPLKALFLAPVTGVAATMLPAFWLNILGLPVGSFARPLMVVFCCIIVTAWIWRRPAWGRRELIFIVPVIGALLIIGFPTFRFGLDWVGNANDDWANYNLSAIRYLKSGFYQEPSIEALKAGADYPGFLWFLDAAEDSRPGCDILLAWVSGLVGRNPFFLFMPLILTFHSALCLAAGGLAMASVRQRSALFAALALTAIAPLSLYAIHQQLIAQVIGIAFMCATAVLTFVPFHEFRSRGRVALTSVIAAAYWLIYPETVPFFVLAFLLYHLAHLWTKDWGWSASWIILIPPAFACLALGPYSISFFFFLLKQFQNSGMQGVFDGISIFPYFLVPTGLAVLFGFSRLGELMSEPWLSLSIGAALLLSIFVAAGIVLGLRRKSAVASYLVVVGLAAVILVKQHNDFGVFKVAMFSQVFLWFSVVAVLTRVRSRVGIVAYLLVFSAVVFTDLKYTQSSLHDTFGGGSLIPGASRSHLLTRVLINEPGGTCDVNYDTANPPLIKVLGATRGCSKSFIARPPLFGDLAGAALTRVDRNPLHQKLGIVKFTDRAASELSPKTLSLSFPYPPLNGVPVVTTRSVVEYPRTVSDAADESIFNEVKTTSDDPQSRTSRLVFVNSSLGSHYYLPDYGITAVFETEPDAFFSGGKIAAVARYLLFRIESPAKVSRLVLDLTASILADGKSNLPPAVVIGEKAISVGLLGHGAARVVSPPFSPLVVDGVAYVLLDLGAQPKFLDVPRTGFMKLYGTNVPIDYRRMVAFVRQVRIIDANASDSPAIPSRLDMFPSGLGNRNLEFSGIYEDGWLGDDGFIVLSSDRPGKVLFRGLFPKGLGLDSVDLALTIEGGATIRKHLEPGPFELELPVSSSGPARIGFRFSAIGRLPAGDGRPAVALLSSVSIEPGGVNSSEQPVLPNLPKVIRGVGLEADGVFLDGWLARRGFVVINAARSGKVVLRGMVPGSIGLDDQEIKVSNGAGEMVHKELKAGPFEIEVPVKAGYSRLSIDFNQAANLPNGDGRNVAALLQSLTVTPTPE
ncbi:hypothetical protein SAMN05444169_8568 [Bradyrhizobium erythrophlei]|uniref:Uncharacterized protein n=1 Tax=Bradyrhizobium erythrophlei TaxID=1437360 RepID=A0A1M5UQP4_9BRAD|nr:hypothetical protein SAMN05444169_8568 [Bradyrhizobium erythrophlei]